MIVINKRSDGTLDVGIDCSADDVGVATPTMTKQGEAKECDINFIMARYEKTGMLSHINSRPASFADLTKFPVDYQTALNVVEEAESQFMSLSAPVRARFDNDPAEYLAFVENPANVQECIDLGIFNKPVPVAPAATAAAAAPAAPAAAVGGTSVK